jgi:hypothetical protein
LMSSLASAAVAGPAGGAADVGPGVPGATAVGTPDGAPAAIGAVTAVVVTPHPAVMARAAVATTHRIRTTT